MREFISAGTAGPDELERETIRRLRLTRWFPSTCRSRMAPIFRPASVISLIVGPIVSRQLSRVRGAPAPAGWQCLFFVEPVPALMLLARGHDRRLERIPGRHAPAE